VNEDIRKHYLARWGEPDETFKCIGLAGVASEVLTWPIHRTGPLEVNLFATIGASAYATEGGHSAEFTVGITDDCNGVAEGLSVLVGGVVHRQIRVEHGSTFSFQEPLWPGTGMTAFVALRQKRQIEPLVLASRHVQFFQAVPIFDYEVEIKQQKGVQALHDWWRANEVRVWQAHRVAIA
jgi:hypothetical protein